MFTIARRYAPPSNNGMELTVKSVTPLAGRRARVAPLFPAAHPRRYATGMRADCCVMGARRSLSACDAHEEPRRRYDNGPQVQRTPSTAHPSVPSSGMEPEFRRALGPTGRWLVRTKAQDLLDTGDGIVVSFCPALVFTPKESHISRPRWEDRCLYHPFRIGILSGPNPGWRVATRRLPWALVSNSFGVSPSTQFARSANL